MISPERFRNAAREAKKAAEQAEMERKKNIAVLVREWESKIDAKLFEKKYSDFPIYIPYDTMDSDLQEAIYILAAKYNDSDWYVSVDDKNGSFWIVFWNLSHKEWAGRNNSLGFFFFRFWVGKLFAFWKNSAKLSPIEWRISGFIAIEKGQSSHRMKSCVYMREIDSIF